jgi:phage terminase small subunit
MLSDPNHVLSDRQKRFAFEYVKDFNATKAAIRAGYSEGGAAQMGSQLVNSPKVQAEIEEHKEMLACVARLTPEWILHQWMQIASANPADIVRVEADCCADCWELDGGKLPPNPDCKRCKGAGERRVVIADTRTLNAASRRLYAGAVQTKDGIKILMRDQDNALNKLADYLGMLNKSSGQLSGPGGGPIPIATATVKDLTDEQLLAIIHAGVDADKLGVDTGVSDLLALPSKTIEGT